MWEWLGPYQVMQAIGSHPYRLEVPWGRRWHNVGDTRLLKPFRRQGEPQHIHKDEEEILEIKEIVNSRIVKGVVQY